MFKNSKYPPASPSLMSLGDKAASAVLLEDIDFFRFFMRLECVELEKINCD